MATSAALPKTIIPSIRNQDTKTCKNFLVFPTNSPPPPDEAKYAAKIAKKRSTKVLANYQPKTG
jgi:hypothetical protein